MADQHNIHPSNVPGKFFVDRSCIYCDICKEIAPANFTADEQSAEYFVSKQPTTKEEEAQCQEALDSCPVECIGKLNS